MSQGDGAMQSARPARPHPVLATFTDWMQICQRLHPYWKNAGCQNRTTTLPVMAIEAAREGRNWLETLIVRWTLTEAPVAYGSRRAHNSLCLVSRK